MRLRILLTLAFLILAVTILFLAFVSDSTLEPSDLLLNAGTEIVGIVLTVSIVEWLFDRSRRLNEAKKLAQRALHVIDDAVWAWQGGLRNFDISETLELLSLVEEDDPILPPTETMLIDLGATAGNTIRLDHDILTVRPELGDAMKALAPLASLRDRQRRMSSTEIAEHLANATSLLASVLRIETQCSDTSHVAGMRDPSLQVQKFRHRGILPGCDE